MKEEKNDERYVDRREDRINQKRGREESISETFVLKHNFEI